MKTQEFIVKKLVPSNGKVFKKISDNETLFATSIIGTDIDGWKEVDKSEYLAYIEQQKLEEFRKFKEIQE